MALVLLMSCSNITNLDESRHIYNNEYITVNETHNTKKPDCPKYIPLPVYFAPEVPLDKIKRAANKSDHEVVLLMTAYIKELREDIARRKKDEQLHYDNYLNNCQTH